MSGAALDVPAEVLAAEQRIRSHIRQTPLERSTYLSRATDADVFLKLENVQITGSFKLRGATNKLLSLSDAERDAGILTASSGNHGTAVAYLLTRFGIPGKVYLPETVSPAKLEAIQSYGAETELIPGDGIEAERRARQHAAEQNLIYMSPYNDAQIVGGQGTIGLELRRQLEEIDAVFIPVGGGGLAAGVAGYLKSVEPNLCVIGCQPENSRVMSASVQEGHILDLPSDSTLADGTAGGIDHDSITFDVCRELIDEFVLLTEDEIAEALLLALDKHHLMIEGAAALSMGAFLKSADRFAGQTVVLVLSGSKLSLETLRMLVR